MKYSELNSMQKDELLHYYYWTDETPEFDCIDDIDVNDVRKWYEDETNENFTFLWED